MIYVNYPDAEFKAFSPAPHNKWYARLFPTSQDGITTALEVVTEEKPLAAVRRRLEDEYTEQLRKMVTNTIRHNDNSESLNSCTINGHTVCWRKETRLGLHLSIQAQQSAGISDVIIYLGSTPVTTTCDKALQLLSAMELHAIAIYQRTQSHLANVAACATFQELQDYDYNAGYPENPSYSL